MNNQELIEKCKELEETNRFLAYEVKDLTRQLALAKPGIVSKIQKRTKIALEDLKVIASRLPQKEGDDLSEWVKYFKGYFKSL